MANVAASEIQSFITGALQLDELSLATLMAQMNALLARQAIEKAMVQKKSRNTEKVVYEN